LREGLDLGYFPDAGLHKPDDFWIAQEVLNIRL
jgi:hypothetical protein